MKKSNVIRQPEAASPDRILKKRQGTGGWAKGQPISELRQVGQAKKMGTKESESIKLLKHNLVYTEDGDLIRKRRHFAS